MFLNWTNLCGFDRLGVGQPHALPEVCEQVTGQSAPRGSWSDAVGDFTVFEGDELSAGHVVDDEGRPLLCGFQDDRHTAVGDELDVQAKNEVLGVTQLEGYTFWGLCGEWGGAEWSTQMENV